MNANGTFDRDLERWLASEATGMPPVDLHGDVMDRARRTRQRPGWLVAVRGGTVRSSSEAASHPGFRVAYLVVILAVLLAALLAVIAAGALRRDPVRPLGQNGAIAYSVSDIIGRPYNHAHLINPDGTGDRAIAQGTCPTYSSNGHVLAYLSGWVDTAQLTVASPDGSSPRVVPDVGESDYALSPDGTQIAWFKRLGTGISRTFADGSSAGVGFIDELWVSPVAGGPGVRIVTHADVAKNEWYQSPVWSPDGRQIAYAVMVSVFNADNGGAYRAALDTVNVDGSDHREITSRPGTDEVGISWSPDGRAIAYVGLPDGSPLPSLGSGSGPPDSFYPAQDVFVVSAAGTADHDLTNTSAPEIWPRWSPDGSRLAYQTFDGTDYRLAILPMAGSAAVGSPAIGLVVGSDYTWSPDGTTLLWSDHKEEPGQVNADNRQVATTSIRSLDAGLQRPASTLTTLPFGTMCAPSWQRLDPASAAPTATVSPAATTTPTDAIVGPSLGPSSESFVSWLGYYGQLFTPVPVPATGVISASTALANLGGYPQSASPDPKAQAPIYGIVTCVDPSKNCAQRGLVRPGESLAIWLIVFPTIPDAHRGSAWATVDAVTGSFITGAAQPESAFPSIQPSTQPR
jgi:WD40-like Beta Propeller Repeat